MNTDWETEEGVDYLICPHCGGFIFDMEELNYRHDVCHTRCETCGERIEVGVLREPFGERIYWVDKEDE